MEKSELCAPTLPCAAFSTSYERGDFTFQRPPVALPTRRPRSPSHLEIWRLGWQQLGQKGRAQWPGGRPAPVLGR